MATPGVNVIYGPDELLRSQALQELRAAVVGDDADLAIMQFEGPRAELADVLDELRTIPLMCAHRVVELRDADVFVTRHREALERYCSTCSPSGTLILLCKTFDARTRLFKAIKALGGVHKCEAPRGQALSAWLIARAEKHHGKRLNRAAAGRLCQLIGEDLAALDSELYKLATYVGERSTIEITAVDELVGLRREEKVFGIADAVVRGDVRNALGQWDHVWATDRAAPGRAVGGLAWAMRRYLDAKLRMQAGTADERGLARQFWTTPEELRQRMAALSVADLEKGLTGLRDADVASKTGRCGVRTAIEQFIVERCARR